MKSSKNGKRSIACLLAAAMLIPQAAIPAYAQELDPVWKIAGKAEEGVLLAETSDEYIPEETAGTVVQDTIADADAPVEQPGAEQDTIADADAPVQQPETEVEEEALQASSAAVEGVETQQPETEVEEEAPQASSAAVEDVETQHGGQTSTRDKEQEGFDFNKAQITRIQMEIAGDVIDVYPAKSKKEQDKAQINSLQNLEEQSFEADLRGYTPLELSRVKIRKLFSGDYELTDNDQVVASVGYGTDDYEIYEISDYIDLSAASSSSIYVTTIVGEADQLADTNKKYRIDCLVTSGEWLSVNAYNQDSKAKRSKFSKVESHWNNSYGHQDDSAELYIQVPDEEMTEKSSVYLSLQLDMDLFANSKIASMRVFEGGYKSASAAASKGREITSKICKKNISKKNTGYQLEKYKDSLVTFVAYNKNNKVVGCKAANLYLTTISNFTSFDGLYTKNGDNAVYSYDNNTDKNGIRKYGITLQKGYSASQPYRLSMRYYKENIQSNQSVTSAFVGNYTSIKQAKQTGAKDIKSSLFQSDYGKGYLTKLNKGKYITIFIGKDGSKKQETYKYYFKVKAGKKKQVLVSGADVTFTGICNEKGENIQGYTVNSSDDSYSEYNYSTIFVADDVNLNKLAPKFNVNNKAKVYATGSRKPEVSGKSCHDFSKGAVQYTVSSQDGKRSKNYWLRIIKAKQGAGELYVNSLSDPNAETTNKDGVIHTTREVLIDNYHEAKHEIFIANIGTENIGKISVKVNSDVVALDDYWTFNGKYDLKGFDGSQIGQAGMQNLGKIVLKKRKGVADGTTVRGTLTIKSDRGTLMVMSLTGTVGDPSIVTKSIPKAVKYVPYGSMIQNSNKYSWNTVSYTLEGKLPEGMVLKQNGEIYGVPKKTGSYSFAVIMANSYNGFRSSRKSFKMKVLKNTNKNVDNATDKGYKVKRRIKDINSNAGGKQLFISNGSYGEFVAVYLDGDKLKKGSDYTSEEGSTRITLANQTLSRSNRVGSHTLGVEFRTVRTKVLKRTAQNYKVSKGAVSKEPGTNANAGTGTSIGTGAVTSVNAGANTSTNTTVSPGTGTNSRPPVSNQYSYTHTGTESIVRYMVQKGDSLWEISEKFYGNGALWWKIAADNKDTVSNPDLIRAGSTLLIYLDD